MSKLDYPVNCSACGKELHSGLDAYVCPKCGAVVCAWDNKCQASGPVTIGSIPRGIRGSQLLTVIYSGSCRPCFDKWYEKARILPRTY
jgi:predicted RNA-binding Zn-ribbon protein involved in translation (DUF1610 family)